MEVIRISGYDLPEKVSISEQYLIPKVTEEHGLRSKGPKDSDGQEQAIISQDAIKALIRGYCREAGVRNLEKHLSKIARKLALAVVQHDEMKEDESMKLVWPVTSTDLPDFVGKPVHTSDILYEEGTPPGVVMGLAWTALGGATLYIETSAIMASQEAGSKSATGGGSLRCTGQLGSVMQESAEIAHHFARRHLLRHDPANTFFERARIHMHIPEGATPKDGPSAGITMVTSLLSLAMERSIASDIAMSGEVSLNGKVLPVGGIKEKVIAARRDGAHRLIFPVGNRRDFDELPEYLKQGLVVHYASQYDEVFQVAFPPPTPFPASQ
jgi:Lon-like ATP-dependent protease